MVGIISSVLLTGLLSAEPTGLTFEGPRVTARATGRTGYFTQGQVPYADLFERGSGTAELSVQERIAVPQATYGDVGRLEATFTLGATVYRVELDQAGFPPPASGARTALPPPPAQPIAGGVVIDQPLHGGAPIGFAHMTRVRATAALWGVGRLWRNGQLLTDTALIHAAALEQGAHADDDTFRVLPVARPGDTELSVLVWNVPLSAEPRGFIQFDFDDVEITREGLQVPAVAVVPNAGVFYGLAAPSSPVPFGTALGSVPASGSTSQPGVGGSGLVGSGSGQGGVDGLSDRVRTEQLAPQADTTLPAIARQQDGLVGPFLNGEGRVSLSTQVTGEPTVQTPGGPPIVPDAFTTQVADPGRVTLDSTRQVVAGQPQNLLPGASTTPFVPESFQNDARVRTSSTLPPATVGGFVPLDASRLFIPSTTGSYSFTPLVPGVSGANLAFGGSRIASGVVTSPTPAGVQTQAVPFVASPQPLIATPPPLGTQPLSATPPVSTPAPVR